MAGKRWRANIWRGKRVARKNIIVLKNKSVILYGEKIVIWDACTSRPTVDQLVLVGPQQADWTLSANSWPTGLELAADRPLGQQQADRTPVGLMWADGVVFLQIIFWT